MQITQCNDNEVEKAFTHIIYNLHHIIYWETYNVFTYNIYAFIHNLQYWIKHKVRLESPGCPRIIHARSSHTLLKTSADKPCSFAYIDSSFIARSVSCN